MMQEESTMKDMNAQQQEMATHPSPEQPERLSFGGTLVLYSQYIVIALLVTGAIVLRLVFGEP